MLSVFSLRRNLAVALTIISACTVLIFAGASSASAAPAQDPSGANDATSGSCGATGDTKDSNQDRRCDPVYRACLQQLPKNIEKACSRSNYKAIDDARAAATWHCRDKKGSPSNDKAQCIADEAVHYIEQAESNMKKPATVNGFEDSLREVLKKALKGTGAGIGEGSPDAGVQYGTFKTGNNTAKDHQCGSGKKSTVYTALNFGCRGEVCIDNPGDSWCDKEHNAILDMLFAIIRFLSAGAGLFIVGSLVLGGIQYSYSRSDPQATAAATNRIRTTLISLLIFIFAYAILNYLIPGAILK
jgi:hypothetical protein